MNKKTTERMKLESIQRLRTPPRLTTPYERLYVSNVSAFSNL